MIDFPFCPISVSYRGLQKFTRHIIGIEKGIHAEINADAFVKPLDSMMFTEVESAKIRAPYVIHLTLF